VVEITRVLHSKPREERWRRRRWVIGAAAAALLLFVLGRPLTNGGSSRTDTFRASAPAADVTRQESVVASAPSPGTVAGPDSVVFAWRGVGADVLYRLTVTDAEGKAVWTESTSDTVLTMRASGSLRRGETYYWFVDALRPDGTSATSGVQRFLTPR
jgi:hypothetical protein